MNRDAHFAAYKSYRWNEHEKTRDPLLDQDICRAIDAQLGQKGQQKLDNGADLYVAYRTAVDRERQIDVHHAATLARIGSRHNLQSRCRDAGRQHL